jgi:hypothetical protein
VQSLGLDTKNLGVFMELDQEQLTGLGLTEEQKAGVVKLYETNVTGLKVKNNEVIAKSNEYKTNLEKLTKDYETEKSGYLKQIEDLDKQIKATGNDELKGLHEAEKKQISEAAAVKISELEKLIVQEKEAHGNLYGEYVKVLKNTELDQAMDKLNNLDPSMRSILRDVFWARYKFDFKEIEQGKGKSLMSDDYKSIGDTLTAFVSTDEGKRFQLANSTGGGATGSQNTKPHVGNPFIKGKENLDAQARLLKENPSLAASLKAQAEAIGQT